MNKNKYKVVSFSNEFVENCIWDLLLITEFGDHKLATIHSYTEPNETEWQNKLIEQANLLMYHSKEILK